MSEMKTLQGAHRLRYVAYTAFIQILIADKTHCTVTLVTQWNAKFSFSLVWKHERNGISSTFRLCGEYEKLISIRVEILSICLNSPDLYSTMTQLSSLRTGDAMRNKQAVSGTWTLSYYIFTLLFPPTNTVCRSKWYAPWQGIWTSGYRPGFS